MDRSLDVFITQEWLDCIAPLGKSFIQSFEYKESFAKICLSQHSTWGKLRVHCPKFTVYNLQMTHVDTQLSPINKYSREQTLSKSIIKYLNQFPSVQIKFPINHKLISPWHDFQYKAQYFTTCYISKTVSKGELMDLISFKKRNKLVQENDELELLVNDLDSLQFIWENNHYYAAAGLTKEILRSICSFLLPKNQIKIYTLLKAGVSVACSIVIIEHDIHYLWLSAVNEKHSTNDALSKLIWKNIIECLDDHCDFHFDGSIHKKIESIFIDFGASLQPYAVITKPFSTLF
ncbi:MAG TPA: hypothetical protein PK006_00360 [Saprospiraceae bacterium]|nr:hypothetical protein [Saprospiraceae bacterium]